jgi:phage gp29-like protein
MDLTQNLNKNPDVQDYPTEDMSSIPISHLSKNERNEAIMLSWESVFLRNFRLAPYSPDSLIMSRGWDILSNMLTMSAVRAPTNVKKFAILHKDWKIIPKILDRNDPDYDTSKEIADFCTFALGEILDDGDVIQDFRTVLQQVSDAFHYGFSLHEIVWRTIPSGRYKGRWGLKKFAQKENKQIGFDLDEYTLGIRNITSYTAMGGYQTDIPVEKCLIYTYNPSDGLPYGNGDARANYKHWWVLDTLMKVWAIAVERFGGPLIVARVPVGDQQAMSLVATQLDAIRQGASAVLPNNIDYELHQLQAGSLTGFMDAAAWHAAQITSNILLQQLTTNPGSGQGSYALGAIHQNTQEYALGHARRDIENVVHSQILRRLVRYNYGDANMHLTPQFSLGIWDNDDRAVLANLYTELVTANVLSPRENFIRDTLDLPPIDEEGEKDMKRNEETERGTTGAAPNSHKKTSAPPPDKRDNSKKPYRHTKGNPPDASNRNAGSNSR